MGLTSDQYIGNPDFRGYLNKAAPQFLPYVGSDADFAAGHGINNTKLAKYGTGADAGRAAIQGLYDAYTKASNAPAKGNNTGGYSQVYAPKIDLAGINAQARSAAENATNPYYSKVLNEFLSQQGALKQRQQTQYDTNIKNLDESLKNTLEGNQITRGRAGEDAALGQQQINTTADQYQTDTGQQFAKDRLAQAKATAQAGLTGGLGAQQTEDAQTTRNTTEQRKEQGFQQDRNAVDLSKARTFEDLGRSDVLGTQATAKGKAAEKVGLDNFLQDASFQEQNKRNELEQQRQQSIAENQKQQAKLLFNNYLAGIKNPAQYLAAVQTYGGSF